MPSKSNKNMGHVNQDVLFEVASFLNLRERMQLKLLSTVNYRNFTNNPYFIFSKQPLPNLNLNQAISARLQEIEAAYSAKKVLIENVMMQRNKDHGKVKMCLVGGLKTHFQSRLQRKDDFDNVTIGIDYCMVRGVDGHNFQVWDLAGQERLRSISSAYTRDCSILLICPCDAADLQNALTQFAPQFNKSLCFVLTNSDLNLPALPDNVYPVTDQSDAKAVLAAISQVVIDENVPLKEYAALKGLQQRLEARTAPVSTVPEAQPVPVNSCNIL